MSSSAARETLARSLFPNGIPRLWCPTLTHFRAARVPDADRIQAHLASLSPFVRGILVPGSTGEGWEMNDEDISALLDIVLDAANRFGIRVLIGVLKTTVEDMLTCLDSMSQFQNHPAVVGFTVCPPKGKLLNQSEIRKALATVLERGKPTALYQLPQVTENEMDANTVASLAEEFSNFILFKDTSGEDLVVKSQVDLGGVFTVRGSEKGGYSSWPKSSGGPYDGFLLSTANVFASDYSRMLELLDAGRANEADLLSNKINGVVSQAFEIVAGFPHGNAFANANKVIDHCFAFGDEALRVEPPLLYGGTRLPRVMIERASELLQSHSLARSAGYWK
jgi:dihydrodipicolinate synthase/N-acetylneuraminate lyase